MMFSQNFSPTPLLRRLPGLHQNSIFIMFGKIYSYNFVGFIFLNHLAWKFSITIPKSYINKAISSSFYDAGAIELAG